MQRAAGVEWHAVCSIQQAVGGVRHVACGVQSAEFGVPHGAGGVGMWRVACGVGNAVRCVTCGVDCFFVALAPASLVVVAE